MVVYLRNLTFWRDPWHDNRPPVANAGGDQTIVVSPDGIGTVVLDGSASTDPDGDELSYWWVVEGEVVAVGVMPTVPLPSGRYELTLQVRDPANTVGTDTVTVTVEVEYPFIRGDANADGQVDIVDPIVTLWRLFVDSLIPICMDAADLDDGGLVDISDAVNSLNYLFKGSVAPKPPFPDAGLDPTPDGLGCNLEPATAGRQP